MEVLSYGSPVAEAAGDTQLLDRMADLSIFSGLSRAQIQQVAHTFDEQWFGAGERILRQGLGGASLHVILEGEATVVIDGREIATLRPGDFFGEVSVLLEEPPTADVVSTTALRCLVLGSREVEALLLQIPEITLHMLRAECRRLRSVTGWRA